MAQDPVKSKLEEIAPYTVSAAHIKRRAFYRCFAVFNVATDLIVALAGIGIGYPLLTAAVTGAAAKTPPTPVLSLGFAFTVLWVVLRVIVTREDGLKRGTLMKSCVKEMLAQQSRVGREALVQEDSLTSLRNILEKLSAIYDRHTQEDSWPWLGGFAPNIDDEVKVQVETWYNSWHKRFGKTVPTPDEDLRKE